jgi:hypothetical protein
LKGLGFYEENGTLLASFQFIAQLVFLELLLIVDSFLGQAVEVLFRREAPAPKSRPLSSKLCFRETLRQGGTSR